MSRPDNVVYNSDSIKIDHQNGSCIAYGCHCEDAMKVRAKAAAPTGSNYTLIEKLSTNLLAYLEEQKITGIDELTSKLKAADTPTKLMVIKTYLCPRVHGLRNDIKDALKTATPEQVDKCARFLEAMCSVAEQ